MEEENRFVEKSYYLFSQTVEYILPLSHLSTQTAGLLCSALQWDLWACLKGFALTLFFSSSSLQTFLLQIWLFLLRWWHKPSLGICCIHLLFGRLPVCFSGMQAIEAKPEWNFMKLSRLIKLYAFNPTSLAVRGHFSVKLRRPVILMAIKFYKMVINLRSKYFISLPVHTWHMEEKLLPATSVTMNTLMFLRYHK